MKHALSITPHLYLLILMYKFLLYENKFPEGTIKKQKNFLFPRLAVRLC